MMAALADGRARRRSIASVGAPADCGGVGIDRRKGSPDGVGAAAGGPPGLAAILAALSSKETETSDERFYIFND